MGSRNAQNEAEYPDTDRRNNGIGGEEDTTIKQLKAHFLYFMNADYITHDQNMTW